jgi:hypothetical protein
MATTKKSPVPDIGNLLGKITEKRDRGEIPKTEIQHVQPVSENQLILPSLKPEKKMGRPSTKKEGVEYFKIGPKIPASLKYKIDLALVERRFKTKDGTPIKSIEQLTELAFELLLASEK